WKVKGRLPIARHHERVEPIASAPRLPVVQDVKCGDEVPVRDGAEGTASEHGLKLSGLDLSVLDGLGPCHANAQDRCRALSYAWNSGNQVDHHAHVIATGTTVTPPASSTPAATAVR